MRAIKRALDPHNIMNPGKTVPGAGPSARRCTRSTSATRTTRRGRCAAGCAPKLSGAPFEEMLVQLATGAAQPGEPRVLAVRRSCRACTTATSSSGIRSRSPSTWPSGIRACGRPIRWRARGRARSCAEMHSGFRRAAQRHDDVHPRARRRAAVVARRSRRTSRASWRSGPRRGAASARGGAVPVRRVLARRRVLRAGRVPLPDLRRRRPRARRARTWRRCSRIRSLREWESAALAETTIIEADEPRILYRDKLAARAARRGGARDDGSRVLAGCAGARSARRRRRARRCASAAAAPRTSTARRSRGDVARHRARYAGIVDYEPTELVITARAGTPLAEIEPRCARRARCSRSSRRTSAPAATLGGAIATGLSGPRRPYAGAVRDLVLGVRVLDGARRRPHLRRPGDEERRGLRRRAPDDRRARHARRDHRDLAQVPAAAARPRRRASFECSADEAIRRVNEWGGQPLPLSATCLSRRARCAVRLSGAPPAVAAACAKLGGAARAPTRDALLARRARADACPFFAAARAGRRAAVAAVGASRRRRTRISAASS